MDFGCWESSLISFLKKPKVTAEQMNAFLLVLMPFNMQFCRKYHNKDNIWGEKFNLCRHSVPERDRMRDQKTNGSEINQLQYHRC